MLDGIETEAVDMRRIQIPVSPVDQMTAHTGIREVDIGTHQIV